MRQVIFLIFLLLLLPTVTVAQELKVKSFEAAPFDLSASTKPRVDNNNNPCALVKVGLTVQGATFAGGIIGDVQRVGSDYWVYMPAGTKMLQIQHPNYETLMVNFPEHGIKQLESKVTYLLRLALPQVAIEPTDAGGNFYAFSIEPWNATLYIDGKSQPTSSDGQYSEMLPYGEHTYRVAVDGYMDQSGTFTISRSDPQPIHVKLASAMASVSVTCPTPAVSLYVDKKPVGTGSWKGELKEGMHLIEGKKDGYRSTQKTIQLAQQQKLDVSLDALVAITGILSVNYKPLGADIYLDGEKVGQSPKVINGVLAGSHKVEVRMKGYTSDTKTITINENQTATVTGALASTAVASSSSSTTSAAGHAYVDLGLPSGTLWATCNVGASKPEEYGDYYAWGETETKSTYDWSTYKWCKGSYNTLTKYCTSSSYGTVDNKTELDLEDDVAHVKWGGDWRMPTDAELTELRTKCTWTWTTQNGVNGRKVTGPNGNSLFLPAAGCRNGTDLRSASSSGYYWSRSLDAGSPSTAWFVYFGSSDVYRYDYNRYYGQSVRPVLAPQN